jgi:anti-sigma regulatory factor (Ser/Thr protein kinase)/anti-anti-sigma regulatory factor
MSANAYPGEDPAIVRARSDGRDVVAELQETFLPMALPVLPQARVAARYLVAAEDQSAGGDWFDVVPLADGSVALVVGDVVGHGVAASAAMGQLGAIVKHSLVSGADLASALAEVDAYAATEPGLRTATLAVVVLDPVTGDLRFSLCGHPPPLLVGADGATSFLSGGTGPLGVGDPPQVARGTLAENGLVLLYTDGLVEREGRPLTTGLQELAAVVADTAGRRVLPHGTAGSPPERVCRLVIDMLARAGYHDDATALAAQRLPNPPPPLAIDMVASHDNLGPIRAMVRDWLSCLHVGDADRDMLELAVGEAVTNTVEHAYAPKLGPVRITAELGPDGLCTCRITDQGRWRAPDPAASDRGYGLLMCERVVDECTVGHPPQGVGEPAGSRGTTVTLRHRLHRPAVLGTGAVGTHTAVRTVYDTERDRTTLRVFGAVDSACADRFALDLVTAAHGGVLPLTVDLTGVTQLSSGGVHALFALREQLAAHQQPFVVLAAPGSTAALVLDLVHLPHVAARSAGRPDTPE